MGKPETSHCLSERVNMGNQENVALSVEGVKKYFENYSQNKNERFLQFSQIVPSS